MTHSRAKSSALTIVRIVAIVCLESVSAEKVNTVWTAV